MFNKIIRYIAKDLIAENETYHGGLVFMDFLGLGFSAFTTYATNQNINRLSARVDARDYAMDQELNSLRDELKATRELVYKLESLQVIKAAKYEEEQRRRYDEAKARLQAIEYDRAIVDRYERTSTAS